MTPEIGRAGAERPLHFGGQGTEARTRESDGAAAGRAVEADSSPMTGFSRPPEPAPMAPIASRQLRRAREFLRRRMKNSSSSDTLISSDQARFRFRQNPARRELQVGRSSRSGSGSRSFWFGEFRSGSGARLARRLGAFREQGRLGRFDRLGRRKRGSRRGGHQADCGPQEAENTEGSAS